MLRCSPRRFAASAAFGLGLGLLRREQCDFLDHNIFRRNVVVMPAVRTMGMSGLTCFDGINHILTRDHFAEHGIGGTVPLLAIEVGVVLDVDEELIARRVGLASEPRHGNRTLGVEQTVPPLVLDLRLGGSLGQPWLESTTLHHESINHAMKDRAVVGAVLRIGDEILDRNGGSLPIEHDHHVALAGVHFNVLIVRGCLGLRLGRMISFGRMVTRMVLDRHRHGGEKGRRSQGRQHVQSSHTWSFVFNAGGSTGRWNGASYVDVTRKFRSTARRFPRSSPAARNPCPDMASAA